jgi:hypothetical protein
MHPSLDLREVGVCAVCPARAAFAAPYFQSRLWCLSRRRSMVVRSSSTERRHSSSVLRSVVVRLATVGMHDAVDARVAIGVAIDALWGATRVVSPPPSVKRRVDHGDNELVDVMMPLPCYRQRSV